MSYIEEAQARAKRVKSPWNLVQIPLTIGGIAASFWLFVHTVLFSVSIFRPDHSTLTSYSWQGAQTLIVIPLLFPSIPVGMMFSNVVVWLIPPLRRIQDREAIGYKGTDFVSSMRGLALMALILTPIGFFISILAAAFGR
jgi:hypothetical protein